MKALLDGQKMQNERKNVTFYMLAFTKDIIFALCNHHKLVSIYNLIAYFVIAINVGLYLLEDLIAKCC